MFDFDSVDITAFNLWSGGGGAGAAFSGHFSAKLPFSKIYVSGSKEIFGGGIRKSENATGNQGKILTSLRV